MRRASAAVRPRVVGRLTFAAPDAEAARRGAEAALTERREASRRTGDSSLWSLGTLRPLDSGAPGTVRYRVTFGVWASRGDRFQRRIVYEMELWATSATAARRIAQLNVQSVPAYAPAWRVHGVERIIDNDVSHPC